MENKTKNREKLNRGLKPYNTNPEYHALTMKIYRLSKKINKTQNVIERINLLKTLKGLKSNRRRSKSIIPNPNFVKFEYVRYADD